VREQAEILAGRLREAGRATFRQLTADCAGTYEVVARFLAVLELYRDAKITLDQVTPLGDLYVTWSGDGPSGDGQPADPDEKDE
jgi:segregation and condensation protein A